MRCLELWIETNIKFLSTRFSFYPQDFYPCGGRIDTPISTLFTFFPLLATKRLVYPQLLDSCQQGSILFTPKDFHIFSPSPNVFSQGIFVLKEDVQSNWTLKISMTLFVFNAPFKGAKNIYVLIFQALVKTFFPPYSFVVHLDFATSKLSQCLMSSFLNFTIS